MKKISTILMLAVVIFISSCSESKTEDTTEVTTETEVATNDSKVEDGDYVITNSLSSIQWFGAGVAHGHNGNVKIVAGKFSVSNGNITKGKITIDLKSMTCTDITDAGKNKDIIDHLSGEDFFNVSEFPTAYLEFSESTNMSDVNAKMTIKGITQDINFPVVILSEGDETVVTSSFQIDRTKFGITYKSKNFFKDLGDRMISDEINLKIKLVSKK